MSGSRTAREGRGRTHVDVERVLRVGRVLESHGVLLALQVLGRPAVLLDERTDLLGLLAVQAQRPPPHDEREGDEKDEEDEEGDLACEERLSVKVLEERA